MCRDCPANDSQWCYRAIARRRRERDPSVWSGHFRGPGWEPSEPRRAWPLTASDSGFRAVTQQVSADGTVIRLSLGLTTGPRSPRPNDSRADVAVLAIYLRIRDDAVAEPDHLMHRLTSAGSRRAARKFRDDVFYSARYRRLPHNRMGLASPSMHGGSRPRTSI